jgi:hypothetical protein
VTCTGRPAGESRCSSTGARPPATAGVAPRPKSSRKNAIPAGNSDPSGAGRQTSDIFPFIREVGRYAVVHTDRLHVAIAACLLGREVHLYPGSYFKNRAVFLSSIRGYYADAHFHETPFGHQAIPAD